MECPSCGASQPEGARFCSSCGQSLSLLTDERRVVTVLFADLVGFTALSENRDPEAVKRVVDAAFERLVRDVTAFGGRVDKIVGDAIVALFGAPVAHEDDPERAVRAALRMQESLAAYGREAGIDIRMRVGVNTGEVLVGALRAGGDYTAMGDVVNLASRLQTAASPGEVVVGDATHRATSSAVSYESRGQLTARGRQQSENVWAAVEVLRPPGRWPRAAGAPLVGRDSELTMLLNAARGSVRHHRGQVLLLIGEAGVGKTRLAGELSRILREEDGIPEYHGRCLPYGEVNPWWPIAEVLRSACGVDADAPLEEALVATRSAAEVVLGDDPAEVDPVVDGLLHLMGHDGPLRGLDGAAARAEAARALLAFLEASLKRGPMVVRIADLHWADDAVFELIDELSGHLSRQPLVFVATARRALQGRWTPRAGRYNSLLLNVDPLDRGASTELLEHLTGGAVDSATRSELLDRSGGNPFYLEELVTLLDRSPAGLAGGSLELPETLRGLIAARVDALSAEEQAVLGDASVWGSSGAVVVLDRIAEAIRSAPSVGRIVQSLAEKDVLVVDGAKWAFRSDLVREVTYARLTKHDRLVRHAGIAIYMDRMVAGRSPDDAWVEAVARHYVEAAHLAADLEGDTRAAELLRRAVHWVAEAARRAEQSGAWPLANRLHGRTLELVGSDPSMERVDALLGRSRVQAEQWRNEGALADARAALELAERLEVPEKRAEALLRMAAAEMRRSEWDSVDLMLDEALETFDGLGNTAGRGETLRQRGLARLLRGDHRAAEEPIRGALEAFRAVGDRRGEGWAYQTLAWIAFGDGRVEACDQFLAASSEAFTEVGDRGGLEWTLGLRAFVEFQRGHFEVARDMAEKILAEAERRDDRFGMGMMHLVLGGVELWSGHPGAAIASARSALQCFHSDTDAVGLEQALSLEGRAMVMAGEVGAGLTRLAEALEVGSRTSTSFAQSVAALTEVQLGLPGCLLDGTPAPEMSPSTAALAALLAGEVPRARELVLGGDGAVVLAEVQAPAGDAAAAALVLAASGDATGADAMVERVLSDQRATYHDRVVALMARGLCEGADTAAFDLARDLLDATEDRVTAALVELAAAITAAGAAVDGSELPAAEAALAGLDLADTAWRGVFRQMAETGLAARR